MSVGGGGGFACDAHVRRSLPRAASEGGCKWLPPRCGPRGGEGGAEGRGGERPSGAAVDSGPPRRADVDVDASDGLLDDDAVDRTTRTQRGWAEAPQSQERNNNSGTVAKAAAAQAWGGQGGAGGQWWAADPEQPLDFSLAKYHHLHDNNNGGGAKVATAASRPESAGSSTAPSDDDDDAAASNSPPPGECPRPAGDLAPRDVSDRSCFLRALLFCRD